MPRTLFLLILIFSSWAQALEVEGFVGANSTTYDETPEAKTWGVSAAAKINFYSNNKGVFTNLNCPSQSILICDVFVGYGWRTSGNWFFETGAGGVYHLGFGPGVGLLFGTGFRIASNIYVNFPIIARLGAANLIFWTPYIGYDF